MTLGFTRLGVVSTLCVLLASGLAVSGPAGADSCPNNGHVWFLGIVYDSAQRDDFQKDVDNFEYYLETLRDSYCIADSNAKILAFENGYTRNGNVYEEGSKGNLHSYLQDFGAQASQYSDSLFFFFLSSHGNASPVNACPNGGTRAPGSFSALKASPGMGGSLRDCELGDWLDNYFDFGVRMFVAVDCSFCGGFSDSLTAVSGTLPDNSFPRGSHVPGDNRIVVTGCAITTECFGGSNGGVSYGHFSRALDRGLVFCDGFTTLGFPTVQGVNAPTKLGNTNPPDGRCTASEWFFAAVQDVQNSFDVIGIQQQFRIKYGFSSLSDDILIF